MKPSIILSIGALLLTACTSVPPPHGNDHMMGNSAMSDLSVQDQSAADEIAFAIMEGDNVFTNFGISHTKEMHLIVVRDDLRHFRHLHPERDASGVWRVPFTAPAGGTYWLYADFVDEEGAAHTFRFERSYEGDKGPYGIQKDFASVKIVDDEQFTFATKAADDTVKLVYGIEDSTGTAVTLEEYLGAAGHSILISPDGDFIHTHPASDGETPVFVVETPQGDFYRVFTQFKIEGTVRTVEFDYQRG